MYKNKNKYRPKIVALIPAYNEEKHIARIVVKTKKYVDLVLVGDDGSTDATGDIAQSSGALIIRNSTNKGKGYTLKRLLVAALMLGADVIVTLDADGQHDPDEIPKLVYAINKGKADIIIGSRYIKKDPKNNIPFYRRIGLIIINMMHKIIFPCLTDTQSGYRVFHRRAAYIMANNMRELGYGTETEQLFIAKKYKLKILEVPISINYNVNKPNKKNPLKHGIEVVSTFFRLLLIYR